MNILLTAIGKRIQLIKHLKRNWEIIGTDAEELIAGKNFVDSFYNISKYSEKGYIQKLLHICEKEKVDFLIPLYEKEFVTLCNSREDFFKIGTQLILSSKKIIEICNDKWKSYKFFKDNNIDTPLSYSKEELEHILKENKNINFPLIIKPLDGMGSDGVFKINNLKELLFFKDYVENPIIQEFVEGKEYTIDVLCDLNGNVISIVPRLRIEVRSGEVVKSRTEKHDKIIKATFSLCEKLREYGNIRGPLTIQCIITKHEEVKFIEINPRFGGGVPLTFKAGVDYGEYFIKMRKGEKIEPIIGEFKEITMIRYDEAVFM